MDPVIVVSADGHASMPPHLWEEYLEARFHEHLPRLRAEHEIYSSVFWILNDMRITDEALDVSDGDGVYRSGRWSGLWDCDVRLEEMDREGVAAEFVFYGDFRTSDLFINMMNGTYPPDAVDAGQRAYDRWAADTFGAAADRLLITGAIGASLDRDALIRELHWDADHGFVGTYAPGFSVVPGHRPLDDEFWDPVWATYADLGLVPVVHGGYGFDQGYAYAAAEAGYRKTLAAGGSEMDLVIELSQVFNSDFFTDLRCRQAFSQLMLGGVFDRHPDLKVIFTEVRADWIPATLEHLDAVYLERRSDLPATRPPSEYWESNCLAGLSFTHRAEIDMRDEIGVSRICFGRDYPHTESTWPNTNDYYKLLFAGVPADDTRKILGENAIEFLGLDRRALAEVAARIPAPSIDVITASGAADEVDPALVAVLADRCGLLKPAEGGERLPALDDLLQPDLARIRSGVA